jgi:DNA repair exonuclease SbcCD ATPase subunit
MTMNIDDLNDEYKKQKLKRDLFEQSLISDKRSLNITNKRIKDYEEVHRIWVGVANKIQTSARSHIENIVTMAIQTVFEENYKFKLEFKEQRNNISCTPLIIENDKEYSPKDAMGGGMLDIIGFALRITLWSMRVPRSRNIFILDEPFRFCGDLTLKAAMMLKKLSEKLNFQVLLVTHDEELKVMCDRVWSINKRKFSKIKLLPRYFEQITRIIKRRKK